MALGDHHTEKLKEMETKLDIQTQYEQAKRTSLFWKEKSAQQETNTSEQQHDQKETNEQKVSRERKKRSRSFLEQYHQQNEQTTGLTQRRAHRTLESGVVMGELIDNERETQEELSKQLETMVGEFKEYAKRSYDVIQSDVERLQSIDTSAEDTTSALNKVNNAAQVQINRSWSSNW
eukprot:CAMPEP_0201559006 /NCGR_PEP_ID=MMETSP0173_2-20130828/71158_1 /ASSEMBLY_ACC=CAM_ASM_000268 /TAXON_ID=218659 /ORGANISM="Vexillifera sp., Strain DIVA3 564/2" /LENGTH=176 /DNA_ID=CAMNT_0047972727 /DNA_START=246 /DNA_END=773 /DNA_ORIENTATION=+